MRRALQEAGPGLLVGMAIVGAARLSARHLRELASVDLREGSSPAIDVVVPARNEATTIEGCAGSLMASTGRASVTVVDDGSTDATGAIAERAGAAVIRADGPPPGWLGKPRACATGARKGRAPWLAFVDADVLLEPWALAAVVRRCERDGLAAASPLLRHRCRGLADRLIVPLAFWQYLVGLPGRPGPARRGATRGILNGQCLVVRRDAYEEVGGHGHPEVRASVVEDSALARVLVAHGHSVALLRGTDAGTVAMYHGFGEVRAGFGKNVAGFLAADPRRGALVAAAGIALSAAPALGAAAARRRSPAAAVGVLAAYGAGVAALAPAYREAGEPAGLALAHPLAAAAMQAIAIESIARRALRIPWRWRGRAVG